MTTPQCTGQSWTRLGRGHRKLRRCTRRTHNADQRCWQHHDQPTIAPSGDTHA